MWLRPGVPPERRNVFYRAFNRVYDRIERWYAGLIAAIIAVTGYWFSRVPTGFLPIEDQGYMIALVQLPDGASLERTQQTLDKVFEIARKTPGVARVVLPECRRSTTARRCPAPACPTSYSRIGASAAKAKT